MPLNVNITSLSILVSHLFGDYILQNDKMVVMKKQHSGYCLVHCILYTLCFWFFTDLSIYSLYLIFIQHFLQDRWNFILWFMNKFGKKEFAKPPFAPWSIFVIDNTFHLTFIYVLLKLGELF